MIRFSLLLSFIVIIISGSLAQKVDSRLYSAADIPDSLKINAHSVKKFEKIVFQVTGPGKASYKVHQIITVLNTGGNNELFFIEYTDKFVSLADAEINLYDASGRLSRQAKKKDLGSESSGEGLVEDGKVFYLKVPSVVFPVTVEYKYELKFDGILNYPDYQVLKPNQSVMESSFEVLVPNSLGLRYFEHNISLKPAMTAVSGDKKSYVWKVQNKTAIENEPGAVSWESRFPKIILAPNKFELDKYPGDMSTWEAFGKWYHSLAGKASDLPEQKKAFFVELVKDRTTTREKAQKIYSYLQENFRYISIQLGIGGFRPFPAKFTDEKKYGDCKALSNYMQAALDAVNIRSYQALVNAGYNKLPVDPDFPVNRFNHVILCIPDKSDTIWLECTSNIAAFGVLGSFTENRNALLITEQGGVLTKTPESKAANNTLFTHSVVELKNDGSATANALLRATGEFRDWMIADFRDEPPHEKKANLQSMTGLRNADSYTITLSSDIRQTQLEMKSSFSFDQYFDFKTGDKMFVNKLLLKPWRFILPEAKNRTLDFYFEYPFVKIDTTIIRLPPGADIDRLPNEKILSCRHGNYHSTASFDKESGSIVIHTRLELSSGRIPAEHYPEVHQFFHDQLGDIGQKLVIVIPD